MNIAVWLYCIDFSDKIKLLICSCLSFLHPVQTNINGLQSDISQQFETLLNKVNSQNEVMTELEERVQKVNICMYCQDYCRFREVKDLANKCF